MEFYLSDRQTRAVRESAQEKRNLTNGLVLAWYVNDSLSSRI